MFRTYNFRCPAGHTFHRTVRIREGEVAELVHCPKCKKISDRVFTICQNLVVPDHMKAPGSNRSTADIAEKNKAITNGPIGRARREQEERIAKRAEAVESAKDKHFQDAVNSTKMQNAYRDHMHEQATQKKSKKPK